MTSWPSIGSSLVGPLVGFLLLAGAASAGCASSNVGAVSPVSCNTTQGCDGYATCCYTDAPTVCFFTDPSGNDVVNLPASCTSNGANGDASAASLDAGDPWIPSADAGPWLPNDFVGTWQLASGSGTSQCGGGQSVAQPVNTSEIDVVTQTGPDTLAWFERGGCQGLPLQFSGDVATLDSPGFACAASENGYTFDITFSSFVLTLDEPAPSPATDAGLTGEDGGDAAPPGGQEQPGAQMTIDLEDSVDVSGTLCTLTAHYVLERAP